MMDSVIEVQGRQLKLSNLEKVLYPAVGFTKKDVIDYYVRIAPAIIPHLAGRALTRKRYPDGVEGEPFFEKNAPMHRPEWVKTAPVWSGRNRRTIHYVLADDMATLVWLANLAALELHPSLSLAKDITCPTMMVFDLDPGPPANIVQCCQVGLWLREIFEHFRLQSFPKTSGSKGLQIYVPLNTPITYEATKVFSHALAQLLEHDHRDQVVSDMKKQVRTGKVFVDWSQNDEHKTTIGVYSLRAREHPTVSTPVTWEEVERAHKKKDAGLLVFEALEVVARFEKMGDLFEPVLELKQSLPDLKKLAATAAVKEPEPIEIAAQAEDAQASPKKERRKKSPGSRRRRSLDARYNPALGCCRAESAMPQLFAGTSGWAYPGWKPDFYPAKVAQKNFLGHYATQLNTVEVNFTFRQLVKETTIQKWIQETPAHFRFGVKAHQVITHIKRLKGAEDFVSRFLATIAPLASAGKLGPILFQLPPNLKADSALLKDFLAILPRTAPAAFEFRHASWFTDSTWELLRSRQVAVCIAETETMTTPEIATAAFVYYRFRKPSYTGDERRSMIDRIHGHIAAGLDVFAYFKHEETPEGALYAVEMLREVSTP